MFAKHTHEIYSDNIFEVLTTTNSSHKEFYKDGANIWINASGNIPISGLPQ